MRAGYRMDRSGTGVDRTKHFGVWSSMRSRRPLTVRPAGGPRHTSIALIAVLAALGMSLSGAGTLLGQATAVRVPADPGSASTSQQSPSYGSGDRGGQRGASVPPQYAPPGGMCRVWVTDVPPAQQPAPTQCAKAVRVRSPNSQVVFGPSRPGTGASGTGVGVGGNSIGRPPGHGAGVAVRHPPTSDPATPSTRTRPENKDHGGTRVQIPAPHRNPPPPHLSARARR